MIFRRENLNAPNGRLLPKDAAFREGYFHEVNFAVNFSNRAQAL